MNESRSNNFLVLVSPAGKIDLPDGETSSPGNYRCMMSKDATRVQYLTKEAVVQVYSSCDNHLLRATKRAFLVLSSSLKGGSEKIDEIMSAVESGASSPSIAAMLDSNVASVFGSISDMGSRICAVRDRRGYSSMYWATNESDAREIVFGSHPENVARWARSRPNGEALARYILLKYFTTHGGEQTFWTGVRLVQPGTVVSYANAHLSSQTYWQFPVVRQSRKDLPNTQEVRSTVEAAVLTELAGKPDIALALSGGMDSTVVATILAQNGVQFRSLTAQFRAGGDLDETPLAREVSRRLKIDWEPVYISPMSFLVRWQDAYKTYSAPLSASTELGFDVLMQQASRDGAKTFVIAGSSDQLFAGNHPEFMYNLVDLIHQPEFKSELDAWIRNYDTREFPKSAAVLVNFIAKNIDTSIPGQIQIVDEVLSDRYLMPAFVGIFKSQMMPYNAGTYLRSFMAYTYQQAYVQPARLGLRRQAEVHDVEVVDPFVSDRLFEWAWSLPAKALIKNGIGKVALRAAFEGDLPADVVSRTVKVGFDVPFRQWVTEENDVREFISAKLAEGAQSRLQDAINFSRLRSDFLDRKRIPAMLLWNATNAVMWASCPIGSDT